MACQAVFLFLALLAHAFASNTLVRVTTTSEDNRTSLATIFDDIVGTTDTYTELIATAEEINLLGILGFHIEQRVDLDAPAKAELDMVHRFSMPGQIMSSDSLSWPHFSNAYHSDEDISKIMQLLATEYADRHDITFISSIGKTHEGRDIPALRFGGHGKNSIAKSFYIQGGLHAREWIVSALSLSPILLSAPAGVLHAAALLLTSDDPSIFNLVAQVELVFVPLVNQDGYAYSRTNDRLWRKNRSPTQRGCYGVDLNRNWDIHFGGEGSRSDPCHQYLYHGSYANSELEVQAIINFLDSIRSSREIIGGIDVHSYGRLLLRPFGYQSPSVGKPANDNEMKEISARAYKHIMNTTGNSYSTISGAEMYVASGVFSDWLFHYLVGEKISFCMELSPGSGSYSTGFIIDASNIPDAGEEIAILIRSSLPASSAALRPEMSILLVISFIIVILLQKE